MSRHHRLGSFASASALSALVTCAACAGTGPDSGFGSDGPGGGGSGGGSSSSGGAVAGGDDSGAPGTFGSSSSGGGSGSGSGGSAGDGGVGVVDKTAACDSSLPIDGPAALFAQALGICTPAAQAGWGLVSASYSNAFGGTTPPASGQWGLLPSFGVLAPREGSAMGAISSGFARAYDDIDGTDQGMSSAFVAGQPMDGTSYPTGAAPPGYPQAAQGCPQDDKVNDMVDVKLVLKAPPDASGFQFDFAFFSSEWPNYVCSNFNDAFVAYLTSSKTTGNISFDAKNNPVAVNIGFLDVCTPDAPIGCLRSNGAAPDPPLSNSVCASGSAELSSTGYADTDQTQCDQSVNNVTATLGASTGWLTTTAPIEPGEQFTLEFMIWDAGDGLLDSSVLLDHFQWLGGGGAPPTTVTMPAPAQ
jgi:hypothetical protein